MSGCPSCSSQSPATQALMDYMKALRGDLSGLSTTERQKFEAKQAQPAAAPAQIANPVTGVSGTKLAGSSALMLQEMAS